MKKGLLCLMLVVSGWSLAQQKNKPKSEDLVSFEMETALIAGDIFLNDYKVYLSYDGEIADSVTVKKSGDIFYADLERNTAYTLVFRKSGFEDRMVMINTTITDSANVRLPFDVSFEIQLHSGFSSVHDDYWDFPVAVYKYVEKENRFRFSDKYHSCSHMQNHVEMTSEEAFNSKSMNDKATQARLR